MGRAEAGLFLYLVSVPADLIDEAIPLLTTIERLNSVETSNGSRLVNFSRQSDAQAFTQILRESTGRLLGYAKASAQ